MTTVLIGLIAVMAALGWTLLLGVHQRDVAVVVNGASSLVAVAVPIAVDLFVPIDHGTSSAAPLQLSLLIGIAGLLHMLGMLDWYDRVWWWDHVTHTVSAALIAAVVYAWVLVGSVDTPAAAAVDPKLLTVGFTMLAGIVWELVEWALRLLSDRLDIEGVVKRYGRLDTPLDILFDLVGAVLVVVIDLRVFVPIFAPIPEYVDLLASGLLAGLVLAVVGSTAVIASVYAAQR